MKISESFKEQFSNYLRSYLPTEISQCPQFQKAVFANFDEIAEFSTFEVCEARKKGLGLLCNSADLAERILNLENGNEFIAGVRFKNLNIEFPFIEVQLGFEPSQAILQEILTIVCREFKTLEPKGLKFKDRPNRHPLLAQWSHTAFGKIMKAEVPPIDRKLQLAFATNLDWHFQYVEEYKARLKEKKELDGFVRVGQKTEFQESVADEALLVLQDSDGFAGVIAGISSPIYGLPAIYMIESYLSSRWVGRKVAAKAHGFFLNHMAPRYNYVWGTIYDKNISSLKTALRLGRTVIETEYFLKFEK